MTGPDFDPSFYDQERYRETPLCPTARGRRGLARKEIHAALREHAGLEVADRLIAPDEYIDDVNDRRIWSSNREPTAFERLARDLRDEYLPAEFEPQYTNRW